MAKESSPLVGIIMGSKSDWETMSEAAAVLDAIRRAARMPGRVGPSHARLRCANMRPAAEGRGMQVIIAGAGGAAHLPGMVAAHTPLPVLGVPVQSKALQRARFAAVDRADAGRRARGDPGHRQGRGDQRGAVGRQRAGPVAAGAGANKLKQFRREQTERVLGETLP